MMCDNRHRILMQFHITGRCNLNCKHCYRTEGNVEPLSFDDVINVIEQFKVLRKEYNCQHDSRRKGHINITGGEPFFRKDIKEILKYLGENRDCITYGILSNGSFIDEEIIGLLKSTKAAFVQLSIDGDREMHDSLRARGDYDRVMKTAAMLEEEGIRTYISFTANKGNYKYLPVVVQECRKRGITKLWSDRLVPIGNGEELKELEITADDLPDYLKYIKKAQGSALTRLFFKKPEVTMNRALQFQSSKGGIYSCSAGDSLITVDEFGNVMPCRRLPIICGNVKDAELSDIYYKSEVFRQLRADSIPKECAFCKYMLLCKGGAKCQSYAKYNSFYRADPACPLSRKMAEKNN